MARITRYTQDGTPDRGDKLIGTDSDGGTKNYSLENIGAFLSQTNVLGVHAVSYTHLTLPTKRIV